MHTIGQLKKAQITTIIVGTAAVTEKRATNRVWRRASPPPRALALRRAIRRPNSTSNAMAGNRLITSKDATASGDNSDCCPKLGTIKAVPSPVTRSSPRTSGSAQIVQCRGASFASADGETAASSNCSGPSSPSIAGAPTAGSVSGRGEASSIVATIAHICCVQSTVFVPWLQQCAFHRVFRAT